MKKLFRTIKRKLRPLLLVPIVLLVLIVGGVYLIFFAGDDDDETASDAPTAQEAARPDGREQGRIKKRRTTTVDPGPPGGREFKLDSDRDEKDYAIAQAIGTIETPQSVRLQIGAAPKQPVTVHVDIVCQLPDEGAERSDDTFTVTPPHTRMLKLPVDDAVLCRATANAQLTRAGKGRIKVFLYGTKRTE